MIASCIALAVVAGDVGAQAFPSKVIRVINPAAPGGNSDIFFRQLSPKMGETLGQQLIIDYRPGAGGTVGAEIIAKSPLDGYTTGIVAGSFMINPSLMRKLPYDTVRDFAPLGLIVDVPTGVVAHPSLPVKRLIAQGGAKRATSLPDLPTAEEAGVPGFVVSSGFSFVGPAGIPRPVVEKLNDALTRALRDPANRKTLVDQGAEPIGNTVEEHAAIIKSEIEKWRSVAKAAGIEPQ